MPAPAVSAPTIAVVFGTYNRLPLLQRAVESFRVACGSLPRVMLVADGGSTDGSREWLRAQSDCELLEGGLDGAVQAFNVGYSRAVDLGCPFVITQNDDNWAEPAPAIFEEAVKILRADPALGGVAFEQNTRVRWQCEKWGGVPYGNTNCTRLEVGMAIARAQGDPTGRAWWDRRFKTYASDTVFGLWMNRLGWKMHEGIGLRVHDETPADELKKRNALAYQKDGTASLFTAQFGRAEQCAYNDEDARRFGGLVR